MVTVALRCTSAVCVCADSWPTRASTCQRRFLSLRTTTTLHRPCAQVRLAVEALQVTVLWDFHYCEEGELRNL